MTARQCFEGLLTELNKVNAPSMLLQDFNYFFNKAINQYINKRYNLYDVNQQTTDDLRVLKAAAILEPKKITLPTNIEGLNNFGPGVARLFGATYEVNLPLDYLHILNCICIYELEERFKCYNEGDQVQFPATKLTADAWSNVVTNFYQRPLPERPYYYIHNINQNTELPTNPISSNELDKDTIGTDTKSDYPTVQAYVIKYKPVDDKGKVGEEENIEKNPIPIEDFNEQYPKYIITETKIKNFDESNLPRTISLQGITNQSLVEKEAGVRYGNPTNVRMEIRYGCDDTVFKLKAVFVDYIKSPQTIRLTQEQIDLTKDTSQMMEFPDNVCQEIINELVHIVMENIADPRLQTHIPVSQSIATPAQQQNLIKGQPRQSKAD